MKKKALFTAALISALLFSAVAWSQTFNLVAANPYYRGGHTPPPEGAEPPAIAIFSPENNTVFASNNISLSFNVTMSEGTYMLTNVWFEVDWQEGNTPVYHLDMTTPDYIYDRSWITNFSYNKNLTGIPEGKHRITIIAVARGYYLEGRTSYSFDINGSSSVYFSIGEPFPTTLAITASGASVAFVSVGVLFYFKKRKR